MCHVILKVGLLALLAVAEHVGEFDRIIDLSQRYLNCHISSLTNGRFSYLFLPVLSRFPRYSGFVFPCLGVHPVQEVSPGQQRGAVLQVDLRVILHKITKPSSWQAFSYCAFFLKM